MVKRPYSVGDKYGLLTIEKTVFVTVGSKKLRQSRVYCKCECGGDTTTSFNKLKTGHTKSCGCLFTKAIRTHNKSKTIEYNVWSKMKNRCLNKSNDRFDSYGGRGITFCKRWLRFENFIKDMGEKPVNTTLDRIDNNKGYCKSNCRWATPEEQMNNTRRNVFLTFQGKTRTIAEWAREKGIKYGTLQARAKRGWSVEKMLK